VSTLQTSKQEENLYSIIERRSWVELSNGGGYFSKFEWKTDPYDRYREDLTSRRVEHDSIMSEVHGKAPFLANPKRSKAHKHESEF
jgi:hypothetical protein